MASAETNRDKRALHVPIQFGSIPDGWAWFRLDELCDGIFDCPHSTPKLTSDGPLLARTQDIRSGVFRADEAEHVSDETYRERVGRAEPRYRDLLYSREGTYFGVAAEVPPDVRVCLGQRMVLFRPNADAVNHRFLRFWLNSPMLAAHIHGFRDGSVAERLNLPTIRALPVLCPPLPEQRAIAHILGTLDDKIELNRRMNATLEAMARALFTSWFVDFDPVRAKAAGHQPAGMDAATAALFPDSFEDSELGEIPRGWRVGNLGDIAEDKRNGVDPSSVSPATPYIGLEHMPRRSIALEEWGCAASVDSTKSEFSAGDILFGKLRPYFHKVGVAPIEGICSTDIIVITPKEDRWFGLLVCVASSNAIVAFTDASSGGTRMPRTSWKDMARFRTILPNGKIVERFDEILRFLVGQITASIHESRLLTEARDALLPRLLSGELPAPIVQPTVPLAR